MSDRDSIEFHGYKIARTDAEQADEGAWWVDDGIAVEFFDTPLDAAAFIGQREVAPAVVAAIDALRSTTAERDALAAAIQAHRDNHRPTGPEGLPDMDEWPCCDDDRILWAAASADPDRSTEP